MREIEMREGYNEEGREGGGGGGGEGGIIPFYLSFQWQKR